MDCSKLPSFQDIYTASNTYDCPLKRTNALTKPLLELFELCIMLSARSPILTDLGLNHSHVELGTLTKCASLTSSKRTSFPLQGGKPNNLLGDALWYCALAFICNKIAPLRILSLQGYR